ncbi:hypothetical protein [Pinibacter aurantiacus]|uniref:WG repeat-containing protein n=1 Tax=Pinibacter aurantiacus TaxID=2851599 RepID=A0A9E2S2Z4_9BACT|nr:hypothetical protein [Pinibacter aurantiacus]MBV4355658.1 hypothetical protein [Pinibacter aurantiacus]
MKKLLIVPACLISAMLFAQKSNKFDFKLGTEYDLPRKTTDLAFVGNQKDGIVNLSLKKEELILVRFNPETLQKTTEQTIDLDATKNFNSEILADFNNGKYFWLHSDWDKSSETEVLYCDKVDIAKGRITDANTVLLKTTKISGTSVATGFYSMKTTDKYGFQYDAARKKMLVNYRLTPEFKNDKKNYDKIGFYVFDENMKKLWGGEFTMPYTEAVMDNLGYSVDADGNAYMLAKIYASDARKEVDKETGNPGYHFEILKFAKDSKTPVIIQIALDNYFIKQTSIAEDSQHELIVACTYSKKSKDSGTEGVFLAKLDPSGKLVGYKKGYYPFPAEELKKFESAKSRRKIDKDENYEAKNLVVRNVVIDSDGGIFLTCEEYQLIISYYTDSRGYSHRRVDSYYGDIIASKIDASGNFQWLRKIPKNQRGGLSRGTMSFKLISDASGYYFLYLDNLKNLNLAEDETPKAHVDGYGGQVMVTKIANDGTISKNLLFDTREEDIMIFPADFYKFNNNQFIGRAQLKKNIFQPLQITVKEGEVVSSK